MLTIGTTAANTFKTALDVTSHNVANVGTEGYSRQRAEISSNTPNIVGTAFLGGGSEVANLMRFQQAYESSGTNYYDIAITVSDVTRRSKGVI